MGKRTNQVAWGLAAVLAVVPLGGCSFSRRGSLINPRLSRYLIPAGYVGWVQVQYGVPNAPPFPREDGGQLIRVPANGVVQTSAKQVFSWEKDEYFYVSGGQRRLLKSSGMRGDGSMIWGRSTYKPGSGLGDDKRLPYTTNALFFVGPEAMFKKHGPWVPPE